MKNIAGLSFIAPLFAASAAVQVWAQDVEAPDVEAAPAAPKILLADSREHMHGFSQYSALIDVPGQGIVACSGLKTDAADYMAALHAPGRDPYRPDQKRDQGAALPDGADAHLPPPPPMPALNPDIFVSSPEIAYDLRPAPEPQPENVKSFGSCKPYPLPDRVADALRQGNTWALQSYLGSPMEQGFVLVTDPAARILDEDYARFVLDIHLGAYPKLPEPVQADKAKDTLKTFFEMYGGAYKLDMPPCANTGYNDDIARAINDGAPLPAAIPLRDCSP